MFFTAKVSRNPNKLITCLIKLQTEMIVFVLLIRNFLLCGPFDFFDGEELASPEPLK